MPDLRKLLDAIKKEAEGLESPLRFMEVCGTHTMNAARAGIHRALPEKVKLISGPGCPVCVTEGPYLARSLKLAETEGVSVFTFGDMLRVPVAGDSLEKARSRGTDVRIIHGILDPLHFAQQNADRQIAVLAVGFETTACGIAALIERTAGEGLKNLSFLVGHKLIPPAMEAILSSDVGVDGFMCPGHVSTIIGLKPYRALAQTYPFPFVVAGFKPEEILTALLMLTRLRKQGTGVVDNAYPRAVKEDGNPEAVEAMRRVFEVVDARWRGIGVIPQSGLVLKDELSHLDAAARFDLPEVEIEEPNGCRCGDVLKGLLLPPGCGLFGKACTPEEPVGPCMVSSEGSCAAWYRYNRSNE